MELNKLSNEAYNAYVQSKAKPSPMGKNMVWAFLVGGLICVIGQGLLDWYQTMGLSRELAGTAVSVTLIFLTALLTGIGVFDSFAKHAGAGTLVPITGFANAVVAARIREEIQAKVQEAGLEILEARITHLAYASEIAAAMLQRQQASAIIDARKMIVEGAVGTVEMALERLNQSGVVELDEERKAAMVSNLLVVLCGNHEAQPVVNTGSLY